VDWDELYRNLLDEHSLGYGGSRFGGEGYDSRGGRSWIAHGIGLVRPKPAPGFSVLVSTTNQVYELPAGSEQEAAQLARRLVNEPENLPPSSAASLIFPLAKGKRWGGDSDRQDNNYCWYVEEKQATRLRIGGYPNRQPADVWTLAYRTCPDHQIMEFVAGLGFTHYVYVHHGSVANADVRLVSVSYPTRPKP
jgi:hypothetical protein